MPSSAETLRGRCAAERAGLAAHGEAMVQLAAQAATGAQVDLSPARGAMMHNLPMRNAGIDDALMLGASLHKVDATGVVGRAQAFGSRIRETIGSAAAFVGSAFLEVAKAVPRQRVANFKNQALVARSRGEVGPLDL